MSVDLRKLLAEWKLEIILPHLIAEEIDVDILEMMKVSHIQSLLSNFPLGIQIRFEYNFEQWRYKIGKPFKCNSNDDGNYIPARNTIEDNHTANVLHNITKNAINLKQILTQCEPDGLELIDIYRKNQTFSMPERSHLINIIVNYYLDHKLPFNLYTSYDIENAVIAMFPNERLDFYRTGVEGKIYTKYLTSKGVYQKKFVEGNINDKAKENSESVVAIGNIDQNPDTHIAEDIKSNCNANTDCVVPNEILLQAQYKGVNRFVKLLKPFLLEDFLQNASTVFNIFNKNHLYVTVNECEIAENDFENVILQYYNLSTFVIEIKDIDGPMTKVEHFEDSFSNQSACDQSNNYSILNTAEDSFSNQSACDQFNNSSINTAENMSLQVVNSRLPNATDIRNMPSLLPVVNISDEGKPLENKDRTAIAKAIIDECLSYQPDRVLKRQDFLTLADNILKAFPNEMASTYYIPSQMNQLPRGKLWNAYNNKRIFLGKSGIVHRRSRQMKRKRQSNHEEESCGKTEYNAYADSEITESKDFAWNTPQNMEILKEKWSRSHRTRRSVLKKQILSPYQYLQKYGILKSNRGIDLIEIDVNILYPTVANISNWLSLYKKVIEMARKMHKIKKVSEILHDIEASVDEKYCASLALLLVPYILPYNTKRTDVNGEKATKCEIQERFIKDYKTMDDLISDSPCNDLQIRFVHPKGKIIYAEFNFCGHLFKCVDLLEALSFIFHYIMALDVEYPKMCLHIWQFIQLAIFQIEIRDCLQPNVESFINDLYMT